MLVALIQVENFVASCSQLQCIGFSYQELNQDLGEQGYDEIELEKDLQVGSLTGLTCRLFKSERQTSESLIAGLKICRAQLGRASSLVRNGL